LLTDSDTLDHHQLNKGKQARETIEIPGTPQLEEKGE